MSKWPHVHSFSRGSLDWSSHKLHYASTKRLDFSSMSHRSFGFAGSDAVVLPFFLRSRVCSTGVSISLFLNNVDWHIVLFLVFL